MSPSSKYTFVILVRKIFEIIILFIIFGCVGSSLLRGLSSVAASGGYSRVEVCGLLTAVTSLIAEHKL